MANVQGLASAGFRAGDRVSHKTFGLGYITEALCDYITVDFDEFGSKKLMIKIAPLTLLSDVVPKLVTSSMPEGPSEASRTQTASSIRKQLLDHVKNLHTRYDVKANASTPSPQNNLREKMQAHMEKLRGGLPSESALTVETKPMPEARLGLPSAITLAGVTFEGRQLNLSRARVGDAVSLVRRPENGFDPNAVEVLTVGGESLGWVQKTQSQEIAAVIDSGSKIRGQIIAIVGDLDAGYKLGARIALFNESRIAERGERRNMQSSTIQPRELSLSTMSSSRIRNGYEDNGGDWEPSLSDEEPLEDETAEGLGIGDVSFDDADSEY